MKKYTDGTNADRVLKKQNCFALLFCVIGVVLNLLFSTVVSDFELPLYLDAVGTVIVAALGGYLPGVCVGFVTNIIKSIMNPSALYYGVLNVLIAFFTAWFERHNKLKKPWGVLGLIAVMILVGGSLSTMIPWFMGEQTLDSKSLCGMLYATGYFNLPIAHFLANIIKEFPDKLLTVFIALVTVKYIPEKYHGYFGFKVWMQAPIFEEESTASDRTLVRSLSLKSKILLVLSISLAAVAVVGTVISLAIYRKTIIKEHTRIAQGTISVAASVLDGDRIDEFLESGGAAEGYSETEKLLQNIRSSATDIKYLYVYKIKDDGCHVVFDVDTEDGPGEETGTVIPFDEGFGDYIPALLAGKEVDPIITDDRYGYLLTAYKPIYNSEGICVSYVGADVDMGQLRQMERRFLVENISVFLGFFIVICIFVIWLTEYHIVFPVNSIVKCVDSFSNRGETRELLDEDIKKLRSIRIHTGDEVEKLYKSVCRMTLNQAEQLRSIQKLSESTAKMQDGLIITMADMVENRDSDTGAHIQKTAAYVKIIVEGLKKRGYYAEKITSKFMSDIVRSAPLHDVGKIHIPDWVLNKPGKLTDEEYEIMKGHTTAGKLIMENAISTVEGENYLKEARNMAAYHHERWDGKGYPEGLHGEVIPLSARIMAVADVFDALVSPRVYKAAFPLEKALGILRDGAGTQFDPKCVEVFMDALPEVKKVMKKYQE